MRNQDALFLTEVVRRICTMPDGDLAALLSNLRFESSARQYANMNVESLREQLSMVDKSSPIELLCGDGGRFARDQGTGWLRIRCTNRLLLRKGIERLFAKLDGMELSITRNDGWSWDWDVAKFPDGLPRTSPRMCADYGFLVLPGRTRRDSFQSKSFTDVFLLTVCASSDWRASECLFSLQDARGMKLFSSYCWNPRGFTAITEFKKDAERIGPGLFPDCGVEIHPKKDGFVAVSIVFPDCI